MARKDQGGCGLHRCCSSRGLCVHPKITAARPKFSRGLCQDRALRAAPSTSLNSLEISLDFPHLQESSWIMGDFQAAVGMDTFSDLSMSFISERRQGMCPGEIEFGAQQCQGSSSSTPRDAPGRHGQFPGTSARSCPWSMTGAGACKCKGSSYKGGINCN